MFFWPKPYLAGMLVTLAGAQTESLGDYARSVRKDEKPASAKKYDNDNLPTSDKISIVGNATEATGTEDANAASTSGENSAQPQDGATPPRPQAQDAGKPADSSDAQKRTTNGSRRLPRSRPRLTCSRANWM